MSTDYMAARWGSIDETSEPERFIRYLDVVGNLPIIRQIKQLTYDLLQIQQGDQILDVGCGLGADARAMATRVGPSGLVIGVDRSRSILAEAQKRCGETNLPVAFQEANAESLGFANNSFDGCRAERIFVHLRNPERALAEMVRVSRPDARIVVFDLDWETLIVDASNRTTTRQLLNFQCDCAGSRWIGRQLRRLFIQSGLKEVAVHTETLVFTDYGQADVAFQLRDIAVQAESAGAISKASANQWLDELEQSHRNGTFFAAATGFCVSGTKMGYVQHAPLTRNDLTFTAC